MHTLEGGCHCGSLSVQINTDWIPPQISPRACDCDFCIKHGAAYVSDPKGLMTVHVRSAGNLRKYRQGNQLADFLLCAHCGVLIGVCFEDAGRRYGVVNAQALHARAGFAKAQPASPQQLSAEAKILRWKQAWFVDVELVDGGQ